MKRNLFFVLGLGLAMFTTATTNVARADDELKPALLVQTPENVFTPMGFDDNDNAQIVLYSNLPSTCHKAGPVSYKVDHDKKVVYVRNQIYYYSGSWCAYVMIPYMQTVNLGIMRDGTYSIVLEKPDGGFSQMATLPITVARTANPDDYLYAPVDHMHLGKRESGPVVTLDGKFTTSCMSLKDVKVTYRPNHVIEILPIAELAEENCTPVSKDFTAEVRLNPSLHGRALIHIRSLNGQSVNQVVDL